MPECPKCKSQNVVSGHLAVCGHSTRVAVAFVPGDLKWYQFSFEAGAELQAEAFGCAECGLVWSTVEYPQYLKEALGRGTKPE